MATSDSKPIKKGTLLIAEDEPELRLLLSEVLVPLADKILVAKDGEEALRVVKSNRIDAILTDVQMPKMTGLQFLAEIRSLLMQNPVVVLTAYGDMNMVTEALRLDATDFLEKPFNSEQLKEVVERALAYGLALNEMEDQLNKAYEGSTIPADEIAKLKKIKMIAHGMRLGFSCLLKKNPGSSSSP